MPVYKKLGKRVSWYAIFYYTDWTGKKRQKKKEGFRTQREAKQYEHDFLERLAGSPSMTMNTLADIYLENLKTRVKQSSYSHNMQIIGKHIRPYFGEMPVNTISPAAIRKWQEGFNGKGYCNYYLHIIQAQLSTLFNFAMKYYGLPNNPAQQAGNCWKAKASREMKFLTIEDFGCGMRRFFIGLLPVTEHGIKADAAHYAHCQQQPPPGKAIFLRLRMEQHYRALGIVGIFPKAANHQIISARQSQGRGFMGHSFQGLRIEYLYDCGYLIVGNSHQVQAAVGIKSLHPGGLGVGFHRQAGLPCQGAPGAFFR